MLLVRPVDVGAHAFERLIADGALAPLYPGVAVPADIPVSAGLRAHSIGHLLPAHATLTGTTALWVHRGGPGSLTVHARVGNRRRANPGTGTAQLVLHHRSTAMAELWDHIDVSGLPVSTVPVAAADALCWEPYDVAVPAVWQALSHMPDQWRVTSRLLQALPSCATGSRRAWDAWRVLEAAYSSARKGSREGL